RRPGREGAAAGDLLPDDAVAAPPGCGLPCCGRGRDTHPSANRRLFFVLYLSLPEGTQNHSQGEKQRDRSLAEPKRATARVCRRTVPVFDARLRSVLLPHFSHCETFCIRCADVFMNFASC